MIFQIMFGQVPNFLVTMAVSILFVYFCLQFGNISLRVSASWIFNSDSSIPSDVIITYTMHGADFGPQ